jgi:hypothetical protein
MALRTPPNLRRDGDRGGVIPTLIPTLIATLSAVVIGVVATTTVAVKKKKKSGSQTQNKDDKLVRGKAALGVTSGEDDSAAMHYWRMETVNGEVGYLNLGLRIHPNQPDNTARNITFAEKPVTRWHKSPAPDGGFQLSTRSKSGTRYVVNTFAPGWGSPYGIAYASTPNSSSEPVRFTEQMKARRSVWPGHRYTSLALHSGVLFWCGEDDPKRTIRSELLKTA